MASLSSIAGKALGGVVSIPVRIGAGIAGTGVKAGWEVAKVPFKVGGTIIKNSAIGAKDLVVRHPWTAAGVAAAGGVVYVGDKISRHKAEETQQDQMAQMMAIQQQMAQAQQGPGAVAYSAHNTVSPEEWAAAEAQMRGGAGPQGGHANKVAAAREAAAQASTPSAPNAANAAAL